MSKSDAIVVNGTVTEATRGSNFLVKLDSNGQMVTAHLSGKLRTNNIRIIPGDIVTVELSPYDLTKGRITWRNK